MKEATHTHTHVYIIRKNVLLSAPDDLCFFFVLALSGTIIWQLIILMEFMWCIVLNNGTSTIFFIFFPPFFSSHIYFFTRFYHDVYKCFPFMRLFSRKLTAKI